MGSTYICTTMKTKLTLSVDRRKLAKLRRASVNKGASISQLVENMADKLDEMPNDTTPSIRKWFGSLGDMLAPEDFEEDSRAGAELRKTEYYKQMKAKHKRA